MSHGFVYILKSTKNGRLYIGSTKDLKRRISEHLNKKSLYVSKYIRDFTLVFCQEYDDIEKARKIEFWLKSQKDKDFILRIVSEKHIEKQLW